MLNFNLKEHLKKSNMTISELSERTGISRNSLGLLINGKSRGIQFDTLEKIARIMNIKIEDLFSLSFDYLEISATNMKLRSSELGVDYNNRYDFKRLACSINIDGNNYDFSVHYEIDLQLNILKNFNSEINITIDLRDYNYLNLFLPINSEIDHDIAYLTHTYFLKTILKANHDVIIDLLHKKIDISLDRISYKIVKDVFHVIENGTVELKDFDIVKSEYHIDRVNNSNHIAYTEDEDKIIFKRVI